MATHSSVLAWRIPGTGEPGGLPSMGLHSQTQLKRLSSWEIMEDKGVWHAAVHGLRHDLATENNTFH